MVNMVTAEFVALLNHYEMFYSNHNVIFLPDSGPRHTLFFFIYGQQFLSTVS